MATTETTKAIRLYPNEQVIVARVAHNLFEGNESQAIRHMIRDYGRRNLVTEPDPVPTPMFDGDGK